MFSVSYSWGQRFWHQWCVTVGVSISGLLPSDLKRPLSSLMTGVLALGKAQQNNHVIEHAMLLLLSRSFDTAECVMGIVFYLLRHIYNVGLCFSQNTEPCSVCYSQLLFCHHAIAVGSIWNQFPDCGDETFSNKASKTESLANTDRVWSPFELRALFILFLSEPSALS